MNIRRALISVSEKSQLAAFASQLVKHGVEILSTDGTARFLQKEGIAVTDVAAHTGFPEMMEGRVKTLHPKIFGGILARRDHAGDMHSAAEYGLQPIDLVVVNLYPFTQTVQRAGVTRSEAIEQIDIGGPSLIRAAAKNHAHTTVVTSPQQYAQVLHELDTRSGTSAELRARLAAEAFQLTATYDAAIAEYFRQHISPWKEDTARLEPTTDAGSSQGAADFPPTLLRTFAHQAQLRYGENPHQRAALYAQPLSQPGSVVCAQPLHGKELSYNNYLDLDAALTIVCAFTQPAAAVIKHNNPCGVAVGKTPEEAMLRAMASDPSSAFGSILGLNRAVDLATAEMLCEPGLFVEAIIAPAFDAAALQTLITRPKWKHNVRLLSTGSLPANAPHEMVLRPISGGALLQDHDCQISDVTTWQVATAATPSDAQRAELRFAWEVVRHVRSNAIVITADLATVGIGAGQMSRIDAVDIAIRKAGDRARGAVLASDAFFPFADSIRAAARAGVAAVIQPGGSKNDGEVVAACNELRMPMIFTGRRHFKH